MQYIAAIPGEASASAVSFWLLEFGTDKEFTGGTVVLDSKYIRLAADLAVFDIGLAPSRGLVYRGHAPLTARRTLKAGFHRRSLPHWLMLAEKTRWKGVIPKVRAFTGGPRDLKLSCTQWEIPHSA